MKTKLTSVTGMGKTYVYEFNGNVSEVIGITGKPPHEPKVIQPVLYNKGSNYHK